MCSQSTSCPGWSKIHFMLHLHLPAQRRTPIKVISLISGATGSFRKPHSFEGHKGQISLQPSGLLSTQHQLVPLSCLQCHWRETRRAPWLSLLGPTVPWLTFLLDVEGGGAHRKASIDMNNSTCPAFDFLN